ncbi:hypothetical protein [Chryseobacterium populi]|uniref:Uncharacterized protein n=1 Tax=Chryseobacterium populi TaxID=1144316 RepID=J2KE86_9FLAO|nr:hypothetical protein [Chryseobacterium populi]EJL71483.1 hypothetical protein PMI13_02329 [Chryseobacterium populi]
MKNLLFVIPLFFFFESCSKTEKKRNNDKKESVENKKVATDTNSLNINDTKLQEDLNNMLLKNDTIMYIKSRRKYITSGHSKEFLYYAILMAEKNNYKEAYKDITNILDFTLEDPLAYNSQYASYCLLKAYEMGDEGAKSSVNYIYTEKGKKIPTSSSVYCSK